MQRVLIIGNGGAGKTTLANRLHARTRLPVIHLDRHYYHAGWIPSERAAWEARVRQLVVRDHWIMDGNYGGTLDLRLRAADTVIFLDRSRWRCLYHVLRRLLATAGTTRRDMAPGCRERFDWAFLRYVYGYNDDRRPLLLEKLAGLEEGITTVILRNERDISQYLKSADGE